MTLMIFYLNIPLISQKNKFYFLIYVKMIDRGKDIAIL
jgi:hypothetical protein